MKLTSTIKELKLPENLKVAMMIQEHREHLNDQTHDYHNYSLGQSPFPPPQVMQEALMKAANQSKYAPALGIKPLIKELVQFQKRHFNLDLAENRIIIGAGSKHIMYLLISALDAHFIVPTPAWVGYIPIIELHKREYTRIRLSEKNGYKLDLKELEDYFKTIQDEKVLVLNNPHNPTGVLYTEEELKKIIDVCRKYEVVILADEIYGLMTYQVKEFVSVAKLYPEASFVTNGISKDRSAAGYRFGTCILPSENTEALYDMFKAYAANMYINLSTPIQYAALAAYHDDSSIDRYFYITRKLHEWMALSMAEIVKSIPKAIVSEPEGGFSFSIDLNAYKPEFIKQGIYNTDDLTKRLLEAPYYIAIVSGPVIGLDKDDFILRLAMVDYDGDKAYQDYLALEGQDEASRQGFLDEHTYHMQKGLEKLKSFINELSI
jgi:aspartate aminotransferase